MFHFITKPVVSNLETRCLVFLLLLYSDPFQWQIINFLQLNSILTKFPFVSHCRRFKCDLCPLTFIETTQLRRHELIHRPDDPDSMKWSCDICGKRFRQNNTMRTHRLSHGDAQARKVHCEYCDATFLTKNGYRSHVGVHTGERPYSCGFCPMTFINTSSAAVHRRIHAVNGLFECKICFQGFKTVNFLKCHMKVHFESVAGPVLSHTK